jgi:ABC-2 type transport system ATP-binding protein
VVLVELTGDEVYDVIRDAVADLGVGLVRLEQRRHHISEVFAVNPAVEEEVAHV